MYFAGVDVGSATTKAVIVNEDGQPVGHSLFPSGANLAAAADKEPAFNGLSYEKMGLLGTTVAGNPVTGGCV